MNGFEDMNVSQAVTQLGQLGFTIWYAYHTTVIVIPRLAKESRESTQELTEKHDKTVRELISDFRADLRDERVTSEKLREAIAELRQTISDVHNNREVA